MSPRRHGPTGPFARFAHLFSAAATAGRKPRRRRSLAARHGLRLESLESRSMLSSAPFIASLPQDLAGKTASLVTVHGRYGNNTLNGDWELGLTSNTNAPPQKQVDRIWNSGAREPFTFSFTNTRSDTSTNSLNATFSIGGSGVQFNYGSQFASYEPNAIKIWARTTTATSGLTINDLKITTPGVAGETVFPGASIAVSQASGTVFQEIIIAGIDFQSVSGGTVTLEGNVTMQFGADPTLRGSALQFHVIATHIPWVDLDVDSNNNGTIDPVNGRNGTDDRIEQAAPGKIIPVGGDRAEMLVTLPAGRNATLEVKADAADTLKFYTQREGGEPLAFHTFGPNNEPAFDMSLVPGRQRVGATASWTLWVEATGPSTTAGDLVFTLTGDSSGPPARDIVRATAMAVNLEVNPGEVDEDGSQGLIYTFTRSMALPTPLTIAYDVIGGTATEGIDYTGLPLATGGRSITISANALAVSVTVFPTRDSEIEDDKTVILTVLPGAGYGLGTRTVATGTILNDDYFLDLILDGLPEETVPGPNELSPGAILPIGGGRKRLDIVVQSPGNAGTIALTALSGADKITLWDAEEGGQQLQPGEWPVGQYPRTLWVKDTGLEGSVELVAMFQNRGRTKEDKAKANVIALDLDIDSDNNDGLKTPLRDAEEEKKEPTVPKRIVVNGNDTDGDHVPDYADWVIATPAGPVKRFTPLVVQIPASLPLASMQLAVSYAASDPTLIGPDHRLPDDSAANPLRIWTKNAGELRNTAGVTAGGNFVPAGRIADLSTLGFTDSTRTVELYVEGIQATAGISRQISIELIVGDRAAVTDLVTVVVVSNTLVIGIDGTDSAEWLAKRDAKGNLINERTMPDGSTRWNSHVRNLVADCEPFAMTYYTAGPDQRGLSDDSDAVFRRARDAARALIQDAGGGTTIALVGWSRGAMIASGVAHALLTLADGDLPRTVAFLGMYDPVDMSNGIPPAWATIHAGVQAVTIIGPTADRQTEDAFNVDYPVADGGFINPSFERMARGNRITTAQGAAAEPQRIFYNASHGAIGGTPGYNKRHRDGGEFPENYNYAEDRRNSILADKDVRAGMRAAGLTFVPDRDDAWYGFPAERPPKEHRE